MNQITNTTDFLLEASLGYLHAEALEWISELEFWKVESQFFQKVLMDKSPVIKNEYCNQLLEQLQNRLNYFRKELLPEFTGKIYKHQQLLAVELKKQHQDLKKFREEHLKHSKELIAFEKSFRSYKAELFDFVETC